MELKTFELIINEDVNSDFEVNAVALVDCPATKSNWFAFKEDKDLMKFATVNEDERILIGAAMIPDLKIYRKTEELGEFYVFFSAETICKIAQKFFEKGFQNNANMMHDPKTAISGLTYYMSFIKDTAKGVPGLAGDYPEGTWFLGSKVKNDDTWAKVKSGEFKGYSVEGYFIYLDNDIMSDSDFAELLKKTLGDDLTKQALTTLI